MSKRHGASGAAGAGSGAGTGGGGTISVDDLTALLFCEAKLVLNVTPPTSETSSSSSSSWSSSLGPSSSSNSSSSYLRSGYGSAITTWELASVAESFCSIFGGLLERYDTPL